MNATVTHQEDPLLTLTEAADYLRVSKVFLWQKRKEGLIQFIKAGKKVLIRKSAIESYLAANTKEVIHG
jgi:excisionase family DNA binding protein